MQGSNRLSSTRLSGRSREWLADDYFDAGAREAADFMRRAAMLGYPRQRREALDFGCGLGRVTRALADHFTEVVGVDISGETVARARALNADYPNCRFLLFDQPDLEPFEDDRFDLIYTVIELSRESDAVLLLELAREFLRVLSPAGLLMLRVTNRLPLRRVSESQPPMARLHRLWKEVPAAWWSRLLGPRLLSIAASQKDLIDLVVARHGQVLQIDARPRTIQRHRGETRTFWVTK